MPISKPDSDPADSSHATSSAAWSTVKRLYQQAVELSGGARETFIAGAEVDEAIRAEVRSLLAYSPDPIGQGSAEFLSTPAAIIALCGSTGLALWQAYQAEHERQNALGTNPGGALCHPAALK